MGKTLISISDNVKRNKTNLILSEAHGELFLAIQNDSDGECAVFLLSDDNLGKLSQAISSIRVKRFKELVSKSGSNDIIILDSSDKV